MFRIVSVAVLAFVFLGCSGGSDGNRETVHPVSGKITLSGAAVANAIVTFSPKGQQPVAMGRTNAEGAYNLTTYDANDGAAAGDYTVMVIKEAPAATAVAAGPPAHGVNVGTPPGIGHKAAPRGKKTEETSDSILPPKYGDRQSDLQATVKSGGENKFDFDLKP
jgi:hypothetical protein